MQTLQNGIPVPTNSDDYNPTDQLATAFDAADVLIRVGNQSARDALVKRDGMAVVRTDLGGRIEVWSSTLNLWSLGDIHTEFTGSVGIQQNTNFGSGALTRDTGQTVYGTSITSPGNDLITLPGPGKYAIHIRFRIDAAAVGTTFFSLRWNDTSEEIDSADVEVGRAAGTIAIPNLRVPATRTLKLFFYTGAATGTILTTRARISRTG
jgi:hypothetical protein